MISCSESLHWKQRMAERHISLPKPFASGDAKDWFQTFEIYLAANGWKAEDQAIKLQILLEGD